MAAKQNYSSIGQTELLFILGSSKDNRGRRVLVRAGGCENVIHIDDDLGDPTLKLVGVGPVELAAIQQFLRR